MCELRWKYCDVSPVITDAERPASLLAAAFEGASKCANSIA
jgi:hypothetical protein